MKRIIKNNIFGFILGLLVAGTVGVFAYSYVADQISYTTDKNENIKSVGQALSDLYEKSNKHILNELNVSILATSTNTGGGDSNFAFLNSIIENYKYFKVTKIVKETSYTNFCKIYGWSAKQTAGFELSINTEYEVNSSSDNYKYMSLFTTTTSNSSGNQARCNAYVTFYNK